MRAGARAACCATAWSPSLASSASSPARLLLKSRRSAPSSSPTPTRRSSRSSTRRRSARASSAPSRSPSRSRGVRFAAGARRRSEAGRRHRLHDDALGRRPARRAARRSSRPTPARTRATCRSTWCRARGRPISDVEATEKVRAALRDALPGTQVFFFTGGIVKRILNFGSPAPIDVEILGYDLDDGLDLRQAARCRSCAASCRPAGQPLLTRRADLARGELPELDVVVDRAEGRRARAHRAGGRADRAHEPGRQSRSSRPSRSPTPKTGNEYYINVRIDDPYRTHVSDLRRPRSCDAARVADLARHRRAACERRQRPGAHQAQVPAAHHRRHGQRRARPGPGRGQRRPCSTSSTRRPAPDGFTVQLGGQTMRAAEGLRGPQLRGHHGARARLHGARVAVQVARRSAGHHVQRAARRSRACSSMLYAHGHDAQREQLHGHHHDGRHRGVERRAAGRLRQRAARAAASRSSRRRSRPGARGCGPS